MTGCLTQEDPIGLAGGLNLYGFAGGDPVNFSDPFGLCPIPILCEAIDVAAIGLDIRDIRRNGLSWGSGLALAADVGGLLLPVVPAAAGATYRGGRAAAKAGRAAARIERHHQLPRAFRQQFERAGLDIERFTVDLPADVHRLKPGGLHTGPENWNKQWKLFFEQKRQSDPAADPGSARSDEARVRPGCAKPLISGSCLLPTRRRSLPTGTSPSSWEGQYGVP